MHHSVESDEGHCVARGPDCLVPKWTWEVALHCTLPTRRELCSDLCRPGMLSANRCGHVEVEEGSAALEGISKVHCAVCLAYITPSYHGLW